MNELDQAMMDLEDGRLRLDRANAISAATTAGLNGMNLAVEAIRSEALNVGAVRGAIDCFERAANTLRAILKD